MRKPVPGFKIYGLIKPTTPGDYWRCWRCKARTSQIVHFESHDPDCTHAWSCFDCLTPDELAATEQARAIHVLANLGSLT